MEEDIRQLSFSLVSFIAVESACDESQALFDIEAQKRKDIEEILAVVQRHLDDH